MGFDFFLPILIIGGIGLVAGVVLSVASKLMAVKTDERIPKVRDLLPGANCGACGYAGCDDYAKAVVENEDLSVSLCVPGGTKAAQEIGALLGRTAGNIEPQRAFVFCKGTERLDDGELPEPLATYCSRSYNPQTNISVTGDKLEYAGQMTCAACNLYFSGKGRCGFGCIGYGDCVNSCPYGCIRIINGVAVVDEESCIGCGLCAKACPHHLIRLIPKSASVAVVCSNTDRGNYTRAVCQVGCIGCKRCEKVCPSAAIHADSGVAVIDYDKCIACGACVSECPCHCIVMKTQSHA